MDKPIYRMSGAGHCPRALYAERLNLEHEAPPPWLSLAAEEGKLHEDWIKRNLKSKEHVFEEQKELTLEFPLFTLTGHIDGLIEDYDHQRDAQLLEIKSMSQFEFQRWMKGKFTEFPSYAAQITCYQEALRNEFGSLPSVRYYVKNRSSGYIDTFTMTDPQANFIDIISKLERIEICVQNQIMPDVEYLPESLQCKRCFYKALCIPSLAGRKSISEELLLEACKNWRIGQAMIDNGDQLVKEAKEIFLNQSEVSGLKKWKFDGIAVNKVDVKQSVTYSKERLLEIFTEEQLKPASTIKLPYSYLRIDDLEKDD